MSFRIEACIADIVDSVNSPIEKAKEFLQKMDYMNEVLVKHNSTNVEKVVLSNVLLLWRRQSENLVFTIKCPSSPVMFALRN